MKYLDEIDASIAKLPGMGKQEQAAQKQKSNWTLEDIDKSIAGLPSAEETQRRLSDYPKLAAAGAGDLVQGLGFLTEKAGAGLGLEPVENLGRGAREAGESASEYWQEGLSPAMKESMGKRFISEQPGEIFGEAVTDPHAIGGTIARSAPSMIPTIGASGLAARVAGTAAAKGLTGTAAKQAASSAAKKAGAIAGGVAEGTVAVGMAGADIENQINDPDQVTDEMLSSVPEYQTLVAQGVDPLQARRQIASQAALSYGVPAGVATGALGSIGGRYIGKLLSEGRTGGRITEALRGGLTEGLPETIQSAQESFATQKAVEARAGGPDVSVRDILNEAVAGGVAGEVMGGALGAVAPGGETGPEAAEQAGEGQAVPKQLPPPRPGPDFIVFPDGSTARPGEAQEVIQQFDNAATRLETEGRVEEANVLRGKSSYLQEQLKNAEQKKAEPGQSRVDELKQLLSDIRQAKKRRAGKARVEKLRGKLTAIQKDKSEQAGAGDDEDDTAPPTPSDEASGILEWLLGAYESEAKDLEAKGQQAKAKQVMALIGSIRKQAELAGPETETALEKQPQQPPPSPPKADAAQSKEKGVVESVEQTTPSPPETEGPIQESTEHEATDERRIAADKGSAQEAEKGEEESGEAGPSAELPVTSTSPSTSIDGFTEPESKQIRDRAKASKTSDELNSWLRGRFGRARAGKIDVDSIFPLPTKTEAPAAEPAAPAEGEDPADQTSIAQNLAETSLDQQNTLALAASKEEEIKAAEAQVNTSPTEAQKEQGNYKKGHVAVQGFDITIEQPKGSIRSGVDRTGRKWSQKMAHTYGYFKRTDGADGDQVDVFVNDDPEAAENSGQVFIVDQANKDGSFDEHKVMLGFPDLPAARTGYLENYEKGWTGLGNITGVGVEQFKEWVGSNKAKKPFAPLPLKKSEIDAAKDKEKKADKADKADKKTKEEEAKKAKEAAAQKAQKAKEAERATKAKAKAEKATKSAGSKIRRKAEKDIYDDLVDQVAIIPGHEDAPLTDVAIEQRLRASVKKVFDQAETDAERTVIDNLDAELLKDKEFMQRVKNESLRRFNLAKNDQVKKDRKDIISAALSKATVKKYPAGSDMQSMDSYVAGWNHAIDQNVKSTLPTVEHQEAAADGYDAGMAWLRSPEGAAFRSGKAVKKQKGSGAQLKRQGDKAREKINGLHPKADELSSAIEQVFAATMRSDIFNDLSAADATPGTHRYIEAVRGTVQTFKKAFVLHSIGVIFAGVAPTDGIVNRVFGFDRKRYGKDRTPTDGYQKRFEELKAFADSYIENVSGLAERFDGVRTVDEAVGRLGNLMDTPLHEGLLSKVKYLSNKTRRLSNDHYYDVRELKEHEQQEADGLNKRPLKRPKLDSIVRKGMGHDRQGKNITADQMQKTFGFAGVTIGKYVKARERQDHMNYAYDAFMDLSELLGIRPIDISLGGNLYFAIGALGRGRHAAHYSNRHEHPDTGEAVTVINVTKTQGDGSVAHEWFHALDFALRNRQAGENVNVDHSRITASMAPGVRNLTQALRARHVFDAERFNDTLDRFARGVSVSFWHLRDGMKKTDPRFRKRNVEYTIDLEIRAIRALLNGNTPPRYAVTSGATKYKSNSDEVGKDYWGNPNELFARAAEAFVYDELGGERSSDYLVSDWVADGFTKPPKFRGTIYPEGDERAYFNGLFKNLLKGIKWSDDGPSIEHPDIGTKEGLHSALDYLEGLDASSIVKKVMDDKKAEQDEKKRLKDAEEAERQAKIKQEMEAAGEQKQPDKEPSEDMSIDDWTAMFDDVLAEKDEGQQEDHEGDAPIPSPEDEETNSSNQETGVVGAPSASTDLADKIGQKLRDTESFTWQELFDMADASFGGTQADGAYTPRDAYDAMELAVNRVVQSIDESVVYQVKDLKSTLGLLKSMIARLPTQTKRTAEQDEFQQFSTPPPYAMTMAWAANIGSNDVVLEPSAGVGGLIAAAQVFEPMGIAANELSPRRRELLGELPGIDIILGENAEQIDNILPQDIKPTVVIMNPPFSATAGRMTGTRKTSVGAQHIEQALKRLQPGGRLVALVGKGMAADRPAFRPWWRKIGREYNVRANIGIDGKGYAKYGTTFDNQLLVIDKTSPTTGQAVETSSVKNIEDAIDLLKGIRNERTHPTKSSEDQPSGKEVALEGQLPAGHGGLIPVATGVVGDGKSQRGADEGQPAKAGGRTTDGAVSEDGKHEPAGRDEPVGGRPQGGQADSTVADRGRTERGQRGESSGRGIGEDTQRGLKDIAADAAKHGVSGVDEALKGIHELFGGRALKSFPSGFDPDTYEKALPHFQQSWAEFKRAGKSMKEFFGFLIDQFGAGIRPYAVWFAHETHRDQKPKDAVVPDSQTTSEPEPEDSQAAKPEQKELTDNIYDEYEPSIKFEGARKHPAKLVESAAMAAVDAPPITYKPQIPRQVINSGALSSAQLEIISRAGQAHSQKLKTGQRKGFLIGDGTGVGKGREIAGIILDNQNKGRGRSVWVSEKQSLLDDAKRDVSGIGMDPNSVLSLSKTPKQEGATDSGIMFTTYDTLKQKGKKEKNAEGEVISEGKSRLDQLVEWFGKDYDGVVVFDEAHNMGNAISEKKARGVSNPSEKALSGIELQKQLPNARVVYVSATAATEVSNLAYAERLGLWGEGTPFRSVKVFVDEIWSGGVAAMEIVARDMKTMGVYMSRSISFDGVTRDMLTHPLTDEQRANYDDVAQAWQVVLGNINEALKLTEATSGRARANVMAQFWGAQQRFFNQVITSMQMPTMVADIEKQMAVKDDKGRPMNSVVIQLVNTNEGPQGRAIAKVEREGGDLSEVDITPKEMLMTYVKVNFPVQQYEDQLDENGNIVKVPAVDSEGNPVLNRDAVEKREALLDRLSELRVVDNPLDILLRHFGTKNVAEITGRKRRIVLDEDGNLVRQSWSRVKGNADVTRFMDGKKNILVFSNFGGTGRSYHADNTSNNKRRRVHYLLQAGWRADTALQGLGRTHRSNQASSPHYSLVTTNLKGQRRFLSSIARRLDQLGAITKGQRQTGGQGIFSAEFNLESNYSADAIKAFIQDAAAGTIENVPVSILIEKMGLSILDDKGQLKKSVDIPVTQFLNRLLVLGVDEQNNAFDAFFDRLSMIIDNAVRNGVFDTGLENLQADRITKKSEREVFSNRADNVSTHHVELEVGHNIRPIQFTDILDGYGTPKFFARNARSKRVYAFIDSSVTKTEASGAVRFQYRRVGPGGDQLVRRMDVRTDAKEGRQNYEEIPVADAREAWDADVEALPKEKVTTTHLITGAVLPIWDRIPDDNLRVVRAQTDEGEHFIGKVVSNSKIDETLAKLGAESRLASVSTQSFVDDVVKRDKQLRLANGWRIFRSRVSGEHRMEIRGPLSRELEPYEKFGVFSERIGFDTRHFIPAGKGASAALDAIIQDKPVFKVEGQEREQDETLFSKSDRGSGRPSSSVSDVEKMLLERFPRLKKKLAGGKIKIVQHVDDMPDAMLGYVSRPSVSEIRKRMIQGAYNKRTDTVWLVADNIADGTTLNEVVLHEHMHRAMFLDPRVAKQFTALMDQLESYYRRAVRGDKTLHRFFHGAVNRIPRNVNAKHLLDEFAAYTVEQYGKDPASLPDRIRRAIEQLISKIRVTLFRAGIPVKNLTPSDLAEIAIHGMRIASGATAASSGSLYSTDKKTATITKMFDKTKYPSKAHVADVAIRNDLYHDYGNLSQLDSVTLMADGSVLIDGRRAKPGDVLYMNEHGHLVEHDELSEEFKNKLVLPQRLERLIELSQTINRSVARKNVKKRDMDTSTGMWDKAPDAWKDHRYPTATRDEFTRQELEWIDSLSDKHDAGIIREAAVAKAVDKRAFKIGGYLHLTNSSRPTEGFEKAVLAWRAQGGSVGKTTIDYLNDNNPGVLFSVGSGSGRRYSAEELAVKQKFGHPGKGKPLKEKVSNRFAEVKDRFGVKMRQGIVDQFASFDAILGDKTSWMMAQLSNTGSNVATGALMHGRPSLDASGAIAVDTKKKGFADIVEPLGKELDDWLQWIAGNRAERLKKEKREKLFSDDDIRTLKALDRGTMADGRDRATVYKQALDEYEALNNSMLDIGVETGLVDRASAKIFKDQGFYVPFYRINEEAGDTKGPQSYSGLVGQKAYQRLKGSDINIDDLLVNVLLNWTHLAGASLKNQAAAKAIKTAVSMGLATKVKPNKIQMKANNVVFVRENGEPVWYELNDTQDGKLVLESLLSLNTEGMNNFAMKVMRKFKRALTFGVTINPEFKIANLLRDTIQAAAVADVRVNIAKNVVQGFKATAKDNPLYAKMTVGGGAFPTSGYLHGADPEALRKQAEKDINRNTILDTQSRWRKVWDAYQDFGARLENVNRAANFKQEFERSGNLLEANFQSRDHLDFVRTGAYPFVRVLAQTVPFLNARLQGLDKLRRAGISPQQQKQFGVVIGAYVLAAVGLYLMMKDDKDYQEAAQWERDAYLMFKVPGSDTMFKLPAPFEVGAIGTMAVRAVEQLVDDKAHGELFAERAKHALLQTLSLNPIPQAAVPLVELWANKSFFTGRDIESQSMKNLSPTQRRKAWTSQTAIGLSLGLDKIAWDGVVLSPVQIEQLVNGYFGWLGGMTLAATDALVSRPIAGAPSVPEKRIEQREVIGRFFKRGPTISSRYTTKFYDNLKDITRAYNDIKQARELKEIAKANDILSEKGDLLKYRKLYNKTRATLAKINKEMKLARLSRSLTPAEKRIRVDALLARRNRLARRVVRLSEE